MHWKEIINKYIDYIYKAFELVVKVMLVFITLLIAVQVLLRALFKYSIPWSEEISLICFIYITFFSMAIGVRYDLHLRVQLFVSGFTQPVRKVIEFLNNIILLVICSMMFYTGIKLTIYGVASVMPATQWPTSVIYLPTPIAGFMSCIHIILRLLGISGSETADNYIKGAFKE